jgi:hypothetical protein
MSAAGGGPATCEKTGSDVAHPAARGLDSGRVQIAERVEVGPAQADVAQYVIIQLGEPVWGAASKGRPG